MNSISLNSRRQRGFTMIEAVIVMAIMVILASASSAGLSWLSQATGIRAASFDLVADLDFARSEAVKRNADVVVGPVSGDWANGWTITVGGNVLRARDALSAQVGFAAAPGALTFDGGGRASLATVSNFQICPPSGSAVNGRVVRIDPSGLSRSTKAACA
jgi:type IV fimbrial biogenesis protein FimT